jgi:hypothetical protein
VSTSAIGPGKFAVDAELVDIVASVSYAVQRGTAQRPEVVSYGKEHYLDMLVTESDGEQTSRVGFLLENVSDEDVEELRQQTELIDLEKIRKHGAGAGLKKITNEVFKKMITELLNCLDDRQQKELLYFYREATRQGTGPMVTIDTKDLMETLGFSRSNNGYFSSSDRMSIMQDLKTLENARVLIGTNVSTEIGELAKITRKPFISIPAFYRTTNPDFDWQRAMIFSSELPEYLEIRLEYWGTIEQGNGFFLIATDIDLQYADGGRPSRDYRLALLNYLMKRLKAKKKEMLDGKYLVLTKASVFNNLGLTGPNETRNRRFFEEAASKLVAEGVLLSYSRLEGNNPLSKLVFDINHEKLELPSTKVAKTSRNKSG